MASSPYTVSPPNSPPLGLLLPAPIPIMPTPTSNPPHLIVSHSSLLSPPNQPPTLAHSPLPNSSSLSMPDSPFPTTLSTLPDPPQPPPPPLRTHHMLTRLQAGITKPKHHFSLTSSLQTQTKPNTYLQVASLPQWRQAMSKEFLALQQQGTWTLVSPPSNSNIIGCRWTFLIKRPADGSPPSYKARLVAQGFTQEFGTDFQDTFSSVARLVTIRLFLTIAVANRWPVLQCDVSNAFLHGHLDRSLYMHQPPGFQDADLPSHVCLLHKAIYGLKQAPRLWYTTFSNTLRDHGFHMSIATPLF